tara:strand:+ start:11040 stop:12038 length:999 start_codon:yes stop_codon:yes gene_type:complete
MSSGSYMSRYRARQKKSSGTTPSGSTPGSGSKGSTKTVATGETVEAPSSTSVDYASALKDQRAKLAEAKASIQDPTTPAADLLQSKGRLDALGSAVKTLEGAAQRQRQAKMTEAGAQPIDSAEQPFTFTSRPEFAGTTPTAVAFQAAIDRMGSREVETSRGQLFQAGGKSPEELAEAARKVSGQIDSTKSEILSTQAQRRSTQELLSELTPRAGESSVAFSERQDPAYKITDATMFPAAQKRLDNLRSIVKALDEKDTELQKQLGVLERAQVLTGSVTPAVAATKAQEQRQEVKAVPVPDEQEEALRRMNKEAMENISDEEIRMLGMGSGGY